MATNRPFHNCKFTVEIEGIDSGGFSEVSGLVAEAEVIEYRDGSTPGPALKTPGLAKFGNVTLKRGVSASNSLWDWFKTVADGDLQRRSVSVILLNARREEVKRWNLIEAWPCKYETSDLNARGNEVLVETLEIVCERIELG